MTENYDKRGRPRPLYSYWIDRTKLIFWIIWDNQKPDIITIFHGLSNALWTHFSPFQVWKIALLSQRNLRWWLYRPEDYPTQMLHCGHERQGPQKADTENPRSPHNVHSTPSVHHRADAGRLRSSQRISYSYWSQTAYNEYFVMKNRFIKREFYVKLCK